MNETFSSGSEGFTGINFTSQHPLTVFGPVQGNALACVDSEAVDGVTS